MYGFLITVDFLSGFVTRNPSLSKQYISGCVQGAAHQWLCTVSVNGATVAGTPLAGTSKYAPVRFPVVDAQGLLTSLGQPGSH